ncbi:MAG: lamin tail domain-containing protein [Planctomycetes bacterium]|nr:lamin tail domain-containing protein [Planctomycetota bacterium]
MNFVSTSICRGLFLVAVSVLAFPSSAFAQLEITELMFNPLSANDNAWEWIEVRNNGASPVDLNGAYVARLGSPEVAGPAIDGSATNTVIPAGGLAVIYDANLGAGNPSNFNDQLFRDAWGLGSGVPLIGAALLPPLSNGGTNFAVWANQSDYAGNLQLNLETNQFEVVSLNNNIISLDYTSGTGFPGSSNGTSMRWNGNGSYQVGSNWAISQLGETGVVTSSVVSVAGNTNSTADIGNPGVVPAGAASAGLLISEIMYNPRSSEDDWEWVEIYNNTGSAIDFGATPYFLDDDDGGALAGANVTSGTVANGATAILYNSSDISPLEVQGAWDPGGSNGTNFIGVASWPALANGGDLVALWDVAAEYLADEAAGTTTNAVVAVAYDDNPNDLDDPWVQDDGNGSIYLADLTADANVGASWLLSGGFGDALSFNAAGLAGAVEIHPGGDIASPGTFESATSSPVDLDGDGDVDGADFLAIQRINPSLIAQWQTEYAGGALSAATSVPEPTTVVLFGIAAVLLPCASRRRA